MRKKSWRHLNQKFALLVVFDTAHQGMAQDATIPHTHMANQPSPQEDQGAEIAPARSAAPDFIALDGDVMVLWTLRI
jgi:hypothetical protein